VTVSSVAQLSLAPPAAASLRAISRAEANDLLLRWGHYLGPCRRPFHLDAWALVVDGEPLSVAVSASTVAPTTAGYARNELVELARLCSTEAWATRVMLRLWREVAARRWPCWPVRAAVVYSSNARHEGRIYRFDGWRRITTRAGNPPGRTSTWSRPRDSDHPASGRKTLWLWPYDDGGPSPAGEPGT
jgi:hypothetical protein